MKLQVLKFGGTSMGGTEALRDVPRAVAERYLILPLQISSDRILVAMADATNVFAMDDIKFMTGYNVEPVVASESAVLAAIAWGAIRIVTRVAASTSAVELPTTRVKRGRVTITVAARGELQGGNSEMLTVPQVGGNTVAITYIREPGELPRRLLRGG